MLRASFPAAVSSVIGSSTEISVIPSCFRVTIVTVSEALQAIGSRQFDGLIADLNIGQPGDGFTVVSAMRRTQPECVNFILTGYPAFETALQAIRDQVDDYHVKPADIDKLVESLTAKINSPRVAHSVKAQPLASFLRVSADEIVKRVLEGMKNDPRLSKLPLSDRERTDHIPEMMAEIVKQLESEHPDEPTGATLKAGAKHGEVRKQQGYSDLMLVDDTRVLDSAIYAIVQENLLGIELSTLVPDLSRLNDSLETHLQESLRAFKQQERSSS